MKNAGLFLAGIGIMAIAGIAITGTTQAQGAPTHGKTTPWAAMDAAVAKVPGGKAISATYTFEEKHWIYDVIVVKGKKITEVEVDATTGKAGDTETVTPEQEAKEMAAELNKAIGNPVKAEAPEKGEKAEKD